MRSRKGLFIRAFITPPRLFLSGVGTFKQFSLILYLIGITFYFAPPIEPYIKRIILYYVFYMILENETLVIKRI